MSAQTYEEGYSWSSKNVNTKAERSGREPDIYSAIVRAEESHRELGFKGVVTTVAGPYGKVLRYVPRERGGGMKWARYE